MNYKNRKIMDIAQQYGYLTVKEFAYFLKIYHPKIEINENGKEFIHLSLL